MVVKTTQNKVVSYTIKYRGWKICSQFVFLKVSASQLFSVMNINFHTMLLKS